MSSAQSDAEWAEADAQGDFDLCQELEAAQKKIQEQAGIIECLNDGNIEATINSLNEQLTRLRGRLQLEIEAHADTKKACAFWNRKVTEVKKHLRVSATIDIIPAIEKLKSA